MSVVVRVAVEKYLTDLTPLEGSKSKIHELDLLHSLFLLKPIAEIVPPNRQHMTAPGSRGHILTVHLFPKGLGKTETNQKQTPIMLAVTQLWASTRLGKHVITWLAVPSHG